MTLERAIALDDVWGGELTPVGAPRSSWYASATRCMRTKIDARTSAWS